jgi:hypothetical protein
MPDAWFFFVCLEYARSCETLIFRIPRKQRLSGYQVFSYSICFENVPEVVSD